MLRTKMLMTSHAVEQNSTDALGKAMGIMSHHHLSCSFDPFWEWREGSDITGQHLGKDTVSKRQKKQDSLFHKWNNTCFM